MAGDQTSFNRMRRLQAEKHLAAPAAGMNVRETIAAELQATAQPTTLQQQMELARLHREGHRDAAAAADTFVPPTSADPDAQRAAPTSAAPLNTREIAHRGYVQDRPLASVTIEAGEVVARHSPDPPHAPFSADHYAPPTSVHPGSRNEIPDVHGSHGDPPRMSADPDADRAAHAEREYRALGFPGRDKREAEVEKRRKSATKEVEALRGEVEERVAEEEEAREEAADANVGVGALDEAHDTDAIPKRTRKADRVAPDTVATRQQKAAAAAEERAAKQEERVRKHEERQQAKAAKRGAAKKAE